MSSIDFQFRSGPPDLAASVIGFAERRDGAGWLSGRELPMPNPMIQFMLGSDYLVDGEVMARAALWGPTVRAAASRTDGPAQVFMAVLTPLGATRIARSPLTSLINRVIDLEMVDAAGWRGLPGRLVEADGFEGRIAAASDHLRRLLARPCPPHTRTLELANGILNHRLRGRVGSVAAHAGLSTRGLHNAFQREVGCGPKQLMRIARLQRVLRAIHPRPWSPETPEDALLEYADQAHLDRDFRELTGLSRTFYVAAKLSRGDRLVHTVV